MLTDVGKKILLKVVLDFVTIMFPTFIFGKKYNLKCVPIFWKKFLLKVLFDIATIECPTFFFGRNLFWNLFQIFSKKIRLKFLLDIFAIMYHSWMFGKKFILKRLPNIWEENPSESFTWNCCHKTSYFYIFEEIYTDVCSNIREEYSSEIVLDIVNFLYLRRSLFWSGYQKFRKKFLLKVFLNIVNTEYSTSNLRRNSLWFFGFNILEENSSENITWNCYLWVSNFLYLGVKFFCKLYLI